MSTPPNLSPQQVSAFPQHETITGVVERLTFYSADDVNPKPVLHWYNSCQEVSDRGWSKKSHLSSGALY